MWIWRSPNVSTLGFAECLKEAMSQIHQQWGRDDLQWSEWVEVFSMQKRNCAMIRIDLYSTARELFSEYYQWCSQNKDDKRMMVDPTIMIVQSLRSFLTAVTPTAVAVIEVILTVFTRSYLNLPEFAWIYLNIPKCTWIYLNLPKFK